jgi:SAM-dependent methyltransferase
VVFDEYAHYYDLLYRDKDYIGEANYIDSLIKKYNSKAEKILDLGCGTGKHAELLAQKGYKVHGVDMSEGMLKEAYARTEHNPQLSFTLSNIQEFDLKEKFDVVTALFHVMSYQTTNEALKKVFNNTYDHLKKDGLFIFDCWYGPAVLTEKPEIRVKRLESEKIKVTRIAEPMLRENDNIVEVYYDVFIKDIKSNIIKEIKEIHIMRYFFMQEIEKFITNNGFVIVDKFEFLSNKPLDKSTWGSCYVAKK